MQTPPTHSAAAQLETYFDRTAVEAWARLTSDAPVSGIRATVRAGRDLMRATLLGWLPGDLRGRAAARCRLRHRRAGGGSRAPRRRGGRHRPVADAGATWRASVCRETSAPARIEFLVGDMIDRRSAASTMSSAWTR